MPLGIAEHQHLQLHCISLKVMKICYWGHIRRGSVSKTGFSSGLANNNPQNPLLGCITNIGTLVPHGVHYVQILDGKQLMRTRLLEHPHPA